MNKFSRRERKLIKELTEEAKALGYTKGYIDGLHDGNPFTLIVESLKRFVDSLPAKEIEKLLEASKDDDCSEVDDDCSEVDDDCLEVEDV